MQLIASKGPDFCFFVFFRGPGDFCFLECGRPPKNEFNNGGSKHPKMFHQGLLTLAGNEGMIHNNYHFPSFSIIFQLSHRLGTITINNIPIPPFPSIRY